MEGHWACGISPALIVAGIGAANGFGRAIATCFATAGAAVLGRDILEVDDGLHDNIYPVQGRSS